VGDYKGEGRSPYPLFNIKKLLLVDNLKINNLTINILFFVLLLSHLDSNDLLLVDIELIFPTKKSFRFRLNYRF
jgi:hypothetical protein